MSPFRRPRAIISIVICLVACCTIAGAQQRRKQKTPRAIALVEWPANHPGPKSGEPGTPEGKGKPIVVPIAILIDGRYYDAGIYMADPVPMALEGGTVYEVQQSGEALGFATIDGAANSNGSWIGIAKYQTKASLAAAERKKEVPSFRPDPEEGPPKLRKGGKDQPPASTPAPPPTSPAPQAGPPKDQEEGRPTLRKPAETGSDSNKPAEPNTAPSDTKKPNPDDAAKPPAGPPDSEPEVDTTGRPRLRRGKPVQVTAESAPAPNVARTTTTSSTTHTREAQSAAAVRVLPAISDATVTEPRSFVMPGSETISPKLSSGMSELARSALEKFTSTHGGARAGSLEKIEIRSFDLSLVNQATVVLMASAHATSTVDRRPSTARTPDVGSRIPDPDLTFWVTVVARENYNGDLRQLAAWTTDSKHLDAYPRMELIDAIDADGDGKGELLFRAVNDLGRAFVISRVTADQLVSLYDSGDLARY